MEWLAVVKKEYPPRGNGKARQEAGPGQARRPTMQNR